MSATMCAQQWYDDLLHRVKSIKTVSALVSTFMDFIDG